MKIKNGYSILELIIAILISTIISIILLKEIRISVITSNKIESQQELSLVKEHLLNLINPKQTWTAFDKVKIFEIKEFLSLFPQIKLTPKSKIISALEFNLDYYLKPIDTDTYCLINLGDNKMELSERYMALSKETWNEAEVSLKKIKSNTCNSAYKIKFKSNYNSPFNNKVALDEFILLPIKSSASVFVDQKNILRKITHSNLNNQPIEYEIDAMEVSKDKNFIVGKLFKSKQTQKFYLKNENFISSYELYAILKDIKP